MVTVNNSRLPITRFDKTTIMHHYNSDQIHLQDVNHVSGMKECLVSIAQLILTDNYVLFGPHNVKVYQNCDFDQDCDHNLDHDEESYQQKFSSINLWEKKVILQVQSLKSCMLSYKEKDMEEKLIDFDKPEVVKASITRDVCM